MVDRIDMSLDEIIKKDRIRPSRPGRGNKFAGRVRPAGAKRATGGTRSAGPKRSTGGPTRTAGTKRTVVKKVGAVRQTVKTKTPLVRKNTTSNTVRRSNNDPGASTWKNDKFSTASVDLRSPVLEITNLHYNVSDGDLKELFREFGAIKKVSVLYDASGRSVGKAEISFTTVASANSAMKKYNGVSLDGRAMTICPKVSNIVKASIASRLGKPNTIQPKTNNARPKQTNNSNSFRRQNTARGQTSNRGQSSRGGRGGARGGGRGGNRNANRPPRKDVTKEELDRDLESYIQRT